MNQVNTVIKTFFDESPEKELHRTLDMFWRKYTKLNHKNNYFDSNGFIWSSKDIHDSNSLMWNQK